MTFINKGRSTRRPIDEFLDNTSPEVQKHFALSLVERPVVPKEILQNTSRK